MDSNHTANNWYFIFYILFLLFFFLFFCFLSYTLLFVLFLILYFYLLEFIFYKLRGTGIDLDWDGWGSGKLFITLSSFDWSSGWNGLNLTFNSLTFLIHFYFSLFRSLSFIFLILNLSFILTEYWKLENKLFIYYW